MIQKWKTILANWIDCYSTEDEKRQHIITHENLLNIFTHIHENFKLDDSKSSQFEAHTIQDFIAEKYPEFKFENGTLETSTEDEVYIAASLLLFFICVNSKNDDIKRVMCSKLNVGDQETILKFSKCLMECSPVLYADVAAAITEACGQDVPGNQVAETPPPLRSLHGEVRRLQAALDAERFDRNYLQEELARTNLKLEKLTKDKEQYKLDILNLKAKISLCCGEQREDRNESRADDSRLQRQLHDLEERLVDVQGRLDDALHERDTYKKKVEDLKQERDKWLSLSQEEADRAGLLTDQLETERRTVQSLKDLVSELRQHNRNNGLDASLLECDDPDTSIQSLHNMSVCSEACANVIEVQLGEERAKIEVLKQQIQDLQDQLSEVKQKYESENLSLQAIISEKDNDVSDLKHRIEAEIKDKTNLQIHYDQEVDKLNSKIVELVQKIKDDEEISRLALEGKLHEIQSLQKHLAEQSKKSGNFIKNLKIELEAEKYGQLKLRDEFDDRIMKLNEKVLNRNNELVELQNNIIQKSEMIEVIQSDLRREKELRDELSNSCNNQLLKLNEQRIKIENDIQQKSHEIAECLKQLQDKDSRINKLNKEVDELHGTISSLEDKCQHREGKIIEKQKEIEFLNDVFQKEQEKLTHKADERYATIKSLQMQLQNEIEYKVQLQNELTLLETSKLTLGKEVNEVKSKSKAELLEKEKVLDAIEKQLIEEKKLNEDLQQNTRKLNEELSAKNTKIKFLEDQLERETKLWEEKLKNKEDGIESIDKKLSMVLKENNDLQESLKSLNNEKTALVAAATEKRNDLTKLKTAYEKLCRDHYENKQNLKSLEANLKEEIKKNEQLQDSNEKDTSKLLLKLEKTEKSIKKIQTQSRSILDSKELSIQTLKMEITSLQQTIESERTVLNLHKKEKEVLEQNLREEIFFKNRLEAEYQKKCKMLEDITTKLKEEVSLKNRDIEYLSQAIVKLEQEIKEFKMKAESENAIKIEMKEEYEKHVLELSEKELRIVNALADKTAEIERISSNWKREKELKDELSDTYHKDLTKISEEKRKIEESLRLKVQENKQLLEKVEYNVVLIQDLQKEVASIKSFTEILEQECSSLKETNDSKELHVQKLKTEITGLQQTTESEREVLNLHKKEKEVLEQKLREEIFFKNRLEAEYQKKCKMLEDITSKLKEEISFKNQEIVNLSQVIYKLEHEIKEFKIKAVCENAVKVEMKEEYEKQILELSNKNLRNNKVLADKTAEIERIFSDLKREKDLKDDLSNKNEELLKNLEQNVLLIQDLQIEVANIKSFTKILEQECTSLKETNASKETYIHTLKTEIKSLQQSIESERAVLNLHKKEKEVLEQNITEEISLKNNLEGEYHKKCKMLEDVNSKLKEEMCLKHQEINNLSQAIVKLEHEIKEFKTKAESENAVKVEMKEEYEKHVLELSENKLRNNKVLADKTAEIECIFADLKREKELKDELSNIYHKDLTKMSEEKREIEESFRLKVQENEDLLKKVACNIELIKREKELKDELSDTYHKDLTKISEEKREIEESLRLKVQENKQLLETVEYNFVLIQDLQKEVANMKSFTKILERECSILKETNDSKELHIQTLETEITSLQQTTESEREVLNLLKKEKEVLEQNLREEISLKNILEAEYQKKCKMLEDIISNLKEEISFRNQEIENLSHVTIQLEQEIKEFKMKAESENAVKVATKEQHEKCVQELSDNELRNKKVLADKTAEIDRIFTDLNREKELNGELLNVYHKDLTMITEEKREIEECFRLKVRENEELLEKVEHNVVIIQDLQKEITNLKSFTKILEQECSSLKETNESKELYIHTLKMKITNLQQTIESEGEALNLHKKEKEVLEQNLSEEISLKNSLKAEYQEKYKMLEDITSNLKEEISLKNQKIENLSQVIGKLENEIKEFKMKAESENAVNVEMKEGYEKHVLELSEKELRNNNVLADKTVEIERISSDLKREKELKDELSDTYHKDLIKISEEKREIEESFRLKVQENQDLRENVNYNIVIIQDLQKEVADLKSFTKILEQECASLKETNVSKELCIHTLKIEITNLQQTIESQGEALNLHKKEKEVLEQNLSEEISFKISLKAEYQEKCKMLEDITSKLKEEISLKNQEIENLSQFIGKLENEIKEFKMKAEYENAVNVEMKEEYEKHVLELSEKELRINNVLADKTVEIERISSDLKREKELNDELSDIYHKDLAKISEEKREIEESFRLKVQENEELQEKVNYNIVIIQDLQKEVANMKSFTKIIEQECSSLKETNDKLLKEVVIRGTLLEENRTQLEETIKNISDEKERLVKVLSEKDITLESLEAQVQHEVELRTKKNEEIAELKRQVLKMSATENRASQIIRVSAKYQAIILKRIAEIKTTAVLKELTNFGNAKSSSDSELRRGLAAGAVTMEDLENFLETTDRHLKRCSEKQIALQKDRDRLTEVNRINESEIINMKKFLTEMSVSFRTFSTVKEVYCQKLSKIVSLQRTVRRDILELEGRVSEVTACRLERGYAAAAQDLAECAMGLERWAGRSVDRMLSPEKIKQAFTSEVEPTSLATANYQNAAVEAQLGALELAFQRLLAEAARAPRGELAPAAPGATLAEVRAEYEDKLNRMKAKMKELFHEEMGRLKQKQSEETAALERELARARQELAESSRAYEEHIRALTAELWSVGEKFLVKQEEADWLRKKHSGSLMSLQHVHSSGLHGQRDVMGRPSDTLSLRSLPTHGKKTEGRGMHMSDEEGEVFDNRCLKELATPRASLAPGQRVSELKRRNSLVPPHLKSSYPAEMQFATIVDEEDIKCLSNTNFSTGRQQRKEVGITAYKKPGPPTPSKQAGRLSATDSELRESLRVEADPQASRKTSTPSRLRSLFRSHRAEGDEGTPRSRRFSSIFRKK